MHTQDGSVAKHCTLYNLFEATESVSSNRNLNAHINGIQEEKNKTLTKKENLQHPITKTCFKNLTF
jgi:hypothetical protein